MRLVNSAGKLCAPSRHAGMPSVQQFVALRFLLLGARWKSVWLMHGVKADLSAAIGGVDAPVNLIGGGTLRKNDAASATSAVAVAAAKEIGIHRYIAMSAGMVALD